MLRIEWGKLGETKLAVKEAVIRGNWTFCGETMAALAEGGELSFPLNERKMAKGESLRKMILSRQFHRVRLWLNQREMTGPRSTRPRNSRDGKESRRLRGRKSRRNHHEAIVLSR